MSYQQKIDEMVGKHVARFQEEISLAKQLKGHDRKPPMPYGYPLSVYRPMHICKIPQVKHFIAQSGGHLSNGVPKILRLEMVGDNLLGIYNPHA